MRILLVSKSGELRPLATRLRAEGHSVYMYVEDKKFRFRTDDFGFYGVVQTATKVVTGVAKRLLEDSRPELIVCDIGMGKVADHYRASGFQVVGACQVGDMLSSDSEYMNAIYKVYGFKRTEEWITGWWDGENFQNTVKITPVMGMMNSGLGVNMLSGVKGESVDSYPLEEIKEYLMKQSYKGPVIYGKSLILGICLPFFVSQIELTIGEIADFLTGKGKSRKAYTTSVHLSSFPFPYPVECQELKFEIPEKAMKHYHLLSNRGEVGWSTAWGATSREASRRVYKGLEELRGQVPMIQYRTDL